MKKLILGICILLSVSVIAINAQGTKIGVVNPSRVIQGSVKGKAFLNQIDAFNKSKNEEINSLIASYRTKEKDAQANAATMSNVKKQETALELQRMQNNIKRLQEDAQRESQLKLNQGLEKFQRELGPLIRQVALEKGIDIVFNNAAQSEILFVNDKIDITNDVITKYNALK